MNRIRFFIQQLPNPEQIDGSSFEEFILQNYHMVLQPSRKSTSNISLYLPNPTNSAIDDLVQKIQRNRSASANIKDTKTQKRVEEVDAMAVKCLRSIKCEDFPNGIIYFGGFDSNERSFECILEPFWKLKFEHFDRDKDFYVQDIKNRLIESVSKKADIYIITQTASNYQMTFSSVEFS